MSSTTRRPNNYLHDLVALRFDHPEVTADTTYFLLSCLRKFRVDKVEYYNATGLAAHNDNFFELALKNGSTKMCAWLTDGNGTNLNGDAAEGSIAGATVVELTKSEDDSDLVADAGDVLTISLDEGGTQTLPTGTFIIHGRYL